MTVNDLKQKYNYKEIDFDSTKIIPNFSDKTGIILIVGSSGSGKSTILNEIKNDRILTYDKNQEIIHQFSDTSIGEKLLLGVGLRSIPTWFRPMRTLSNGEQYRAKMALSIHQGINVIDEFTSVVDRNTAKSLSWSFRKLYDKMQIQHPIFIASCHDDIEEWLCPDHIYNTNTNQFEAKKYFTKPKIELTIQSSSYAYWEYFKKHHYLDTHMNVSVHSYLCKWNDQPVAFNGVIHSTGGAVHSYWRESRLVVLPEFQGLGIGKEFSNALANEYTKRKMRYYCRTAHPSLGEYRNRTPELWRPTGSNMKTSKWFKKDGSPIDGNLGKSMELMIRDANRVCYSHEYIGNGDLSEYKTVQKNPNIPDLTLLME